MEKAEIKRIGAYIKDWEERLPRLLYDRMALEIELPEFHRVIKRLMDATYEPKDSKLKTLLTTLEYRARKCKERIEELLAEWN